MNNVQGVIRIGIGSFFDGNLRSGEKVNDELYVEQKDRVLIIETALWDGPHREARTTETYIKKEAEVIGYPTYDCSMDFDVWPSVITLMEFVKRLYTEGPDLGEFVIEEEGEFKAIRYGHRNAVFDTIFTSDKRMSKEKGFNGCLYPMFMNDDMFREMGDSDVTHRVYIVDHFARGGQEYEFITPIMAWHTD